MDTDVTSSFDYPAYFSRSRHPLITDRQSFQEYGFHWLHLWAFWNKWRRSWWQAFTGAIFSCSILLLRTSSWSWGWWLFSCLIKLVVLKECRLTPPRITSALRALQIAVLTCWSLWLPLILKIQHRHMCTGNMPSFQPGTTFYYKQMWRHFLCPCASLMETMLSVISQWDFADIHDPQKISLFNLALPWLFFQLLLVVLFRHACKSQVEKMTVLLLRLEF